MYHSITFSFNHSWLNEDKHTQELRLNTALYARSFVTISFPPELLVMIEQSLEEHLGPLNSNYTSKSLSPSIFKNMGETVVTFREA